jgi:hypothetical protein
MSTAAPVNIRDRILELRRVPSAELLDNDRNWRLHPYAQRLAVAELLEQVGIVGALTGYHSERNGGQLTLIDGHERKDHEADWPVLILDVTDEEADLLLLTLDPMVGLADVDGERLGDLLSETSTGTPALEDLLRQLGVTARGEMEEEEEPEEHLDGPPEMELQPFEHYDYVVVLFRDALDWAAMVERFGLEKSSVTLSDGERKRTGRGRVIEGQRLLSMLRDQR